MTEPEYEPEIECHYCGTAFPNKEDFRVAENEFIVGDNVVTVRERICETCYQMDGGTNE